MKLSSQSGLKGAPGCANRDHENGVRKQVRGATPPPQQEKKTENGRIFGAALEGSGLSEGEDCFSKVKTSGVDEHVGQRGVAAHWRLRVASTDNFISVFSGEGVQI